MVKDLCDLLLDAPLEVDEQVTARNQIEPREGRVTEQVVPREDDQLANFLPDAVSAVFLHEVAPQSLRADVRPDVAGIEAIASLFERLIVQVAREDLDAWRSLM